MKSWKKRWNEELKSIVPELSDGIKNAPTPGSVNVHDNGGTAVLSRNRAVALAAAALAVVVALIACLVFLLPRRSGEFVFTVEINPAVAMTADDGGVVTGVMAVNADADVLLSADGVRDRLVGEKVERAVEYYTDLAAQCGYLDLSKSGSAVRISGSGNAHLLGSAQSALEQYFASNGILAVVVCEQVDAQEISARCGIPAGQTGAAAGYIRQKKSLYYERTAENKDVAELRDLYESDIVADKLMKAVKGSLSDNFEKLEKNAADIKNLYDLYIDIYRHEDNPAKIFKDYWKVKDKYGEGLTGEFAKLVKDMDEALAKYKTDYGVEITSWEKLSAASQSYAALSVETLARLLDDFSYELYASFSDELSGIMDIAGIAPGGMTELLQLPQTAEEYLEKTCAALGSEFGYRIEEYKSIYGQTREPLTGEEYAAYLDGIVSEYGSLSDYWKAIK